MQLNVMKLRIEDKMHRTTLPGISGSSSQFGGLLQVKAQDLFQQSTCIVLEFGWNENCRFTLLETKTGSHCLRLGRH